MTRATRMKVAGKSGNNGNGADEQEVHTLSITVINFQTQDLLSEFFDDMRFTGTNKFGAFVYYGSRTYVFF